MSSPKRRGDSIMTVSGRVFWPLDPRPEEVSLDDIAMGLSNECRYGGQIDPYYTVAQHSVLVALSLPMSLRKQGLLHDATEAYIKDIPRPLKKYLHDYGPIEENLARCIGARFDVELVHLDRLVHEADERCLETEKRDLRNPLKGVTRSSAPRPWRARITPWSHEEARKAFLGLAAALGIR
jgi:uncharacterized protein